jgi:hypothetical protein
MSDPVYLGLTVPPSLTKTAAGEDLYLSAFGSDTEQGDLTVESQVTVKQTEVGATGSFCAINWTGNLPAGTGSVSATPGNATYRLSKGVGPTIPTGGGVLGIQQDALELFRYGPATNSSIEPEIFSQSRVIQIAPKVGFTPGLEFGDNIQIVADTRTSGYVSTGRSFVNRVQNFQSTIVCNSCPNLLDNASGTVPTELNLRDGSFFRLVPALDSIFQAANLPGTSTLAPGSFRMLVQFINSQFIDPTGLTFNLTAQCRSFAYQRLVGSSDLTLGELVSVPCSVTRWTPTTGVGPIRDGWVITGTMPYAWSGTIQFFPAYNDQPYAPGVQQQPVVELTVSRVLNLSS